VLFVYCIILAGLDLGAVMGAYIHGAVIGIIIYAIISFLIYLLLANSSIAGGKAIDKFDNSLVAVFIFNVLTGFVVFYSVGFIIEINDLFVLKRYSAVAVVAVFGSLNIIYLLIFGENTSDHKLETNKPNSYATKYNSNYKPPYNSDCTPNINNIISNSSNINSKTNSVSMERVETSHNEPGSLAVGCMTIFFGLLILFLIFIIPYISIPFGILIVGLAGWFARGNPRF
jgi:hypothetical protein